MSKEKKPSPGGRIKKLREAKGLSPADVVLELNKKGIYFGNAEETGRQTITQFESGKRSLMLEHAFAYAEIFDTTLDYIYCRSDDPKPQNKDIREATALSDEAIAYFERLTRPFNDDDVFYSKIANLLIESGFFDGIVANMAAALGYSAILQYAGDGLVDVLKLANQTKLGFTQAIMNEYDNFMSKYSGKLFDMALAFSSDKGHIDEMAQEYRDMADKLLTLAEQDAFTISDGE